MGFFKRLFGICSTQPPADPGCWAVVDGRAVVDLGRAPELKDPGGAVRLEGGELARRVLLLRGEDGKLHAFVNKCSHGGRRLDPLPGAGKVECCSVGKSVFDYEGKLQSGSAKKDILSLEVAEEESKAVVSLP